MRNLYLALVLVFGTLSLALAQTGSNGANGQLKQSPLPAAGSPSLSYPKVVLYSTSWCPHCRAAKEYFTSHNIPFINRDVELDEEAMNTLTTKYKSQGVPVIVIGDDAEVLKGFDQGRFEKALQKVKRK